MKTFSSEFQHNYKNYSFGYCNYCLIEEGDKLSDIYAAGYLPYSNSPDAKNIFYMARSARVPLTDLAFSSENRRVARKFDGRFSRISTAVSKFDIQDKKFLSFCVEYFAKRHGPAIMPPERFEVILNSGVITHVVSYYQDSQPKAYVLECSDDKMTHFWFSFYDLSLIRQSLGMWLMLDSARFAKNRGADYLYVGTVYGEKAFYKTAFKNLEYWDGGKWIADIKKLKFICRSEHKRKINLVDELKKEWKTF